MTFKQSLSPSDPVPSTVPCKPCITTWHSHKVSIRTAKAVGERIRSHSLAVMVPSESTSCRDKTAADKPGTAGAPDEASNRPSAGNCSRSDKAATDKQGTVALNQNTALVYNELEKMSQNPMNQLCALSPKTTACFDPEEAWILDVLLTRHPSSAAPTSSSPQFPVSIRCCQPNYVRCCRSPPPSKHCEKGLDVWLPSP